MESPKFRIICSSGRLFKKAGLNLIVLKIPQAEVCMLRAKMIGHGLEGKTLSSFLIN